MKYTYEMRYDGFKSRRESSIVSQAVAVLLNHFQDTELLIGLRVYAAAEERRLEDVVISALYGVAMAGIEHLEELPQETARVMRAMAAGPVGRIRPPRGTQRILDKQEAYLAAFGESGDLEEARKQVGVSQSLPYKWAHSSEEFRTRWNEVRGWYNIEPV